MKNNDHKKIVWQDNFIKRWTCSAKNLPQGWAWWKKHNRKVTRQKQKKENTMMNVCDICDQDPGACRFCQFGNPCLNCEDYDFDNDKCTSNGACGEKRENNE